MCENRLDFGKQQGGTTTWQTILYCRIQLLWGRAGGFVYTADIYIGGVCVRNKLHNVCLASLVCLRVPNGGCAHFYDELRCTEGKHKRRDRKPQCVCGSDWPLLPPSTPNLIPLRRAVKLMADHFTHPSFNGTAVPSLLGTVWFLRVAHL